MSSTKAFNPFYGLLLIVGIAFCVTACAFAVMTVREMRPAPAAIETSDDSMATSQSGEQLMVWMDKHGFNLLMIELVALAGLTFAAIATDEYWTRRSERKSNASLPKTNGTDPSTQ